MKKRVKQLSHMMEEIDINNQDNNKEYQAKEDEKMYHPMRAVFIALDMTKTIQMKDFKPSRLSVATQMIKNFIKKSKQTTPLIKYAFAIVQQQICKIKCAFTLDTNTIFDVIDLLKVQNQGYFSLENVLRSALESFQTVSNCYKKQVFIKQFFRQLLIIQASSFTKDYRNVFDTIELFQQARITVNIVSLVGWTHVFKKLVQKTEGKYVTVGSNEQFKRFIEQISLPSQMIEDNIQKTMFKVGLCKKEFNQKGVQCFCHFELVQNYYVCGFCSAISCKIPPIECSVCKKLIIVPSDLSRHKLIDYKTA